MLWFGVMKNERCVALMNYSLKPRTIVTIYPTQCTHLRPSLSTTMVCSTSASAPGRLFSSARNTSVEPAEKEAFSHWEVGARTSGKDCEESATRYETRRSDEIMVRGQCTVKTERSRTRQQIQIILACEANKKSGEKTGNQVKRTCLACSRSTSCTAGRSTAAA